MKHHLPFGKYKNQKQKPLPNESDKAFYISFVMIPPKLIRIPPNLNLFRENRKEFRPILNYSAKITTFSAKQYN
jgi:hypothetical protein